MPSSSEARPRRTGPIVIGAVIAAAGLAFGGLTAAYAASHSAGGHPSVAQQAKHVQAEDNHVPKDGNALLNVNVLEDQVEHYYGSASRTYPVVGKVTVPASNSPYARQMRAISTRAIAWLAAAKKHVKPGEKPAVVFDIDDTLVNTYDYTLSAQFGYDPTENAVWVNNAAFPAVFGMPKVVAAARHDGFSTFFITGRPEAQRSATVANLKQDGYGTVSDSHLFLKPTTPPAYLNCPSTGCSTIQYKSGTRAHLAAGGYTIVADFGDQFSDLLGGHAGHQVKLPNPMYYLP